VKTEVPVRAGVVMKYTVESYKVAIFSHGLCRLPLKYLAQASGGNGSDV
jgi:hypothetical protein